MRALHVRLCFLNASFLSFPLKLQQVLVITYFSFLMSFFSANLLFSMQLSRYYWWAQVDSNHRPRAYQARALTN